MGHLRDNMDSERKALIEKGMSKLDAARTVFAMAKLGLISSKPKPS